MTEQLTESEKSMRQFKLFIFLTVIVPFILLAIFIELRVESVEDSLEHQATIAARAPGSRDEARSEIDVLPWHPVQGQQLYVPAYSHVFHQKGDPYLLTVTLHIRNTDVSDDIVIMSARYFDTAGRELQSLLKKPLRLGPLAATEFVIAQSDNTGGSGASFLVEWTAGKEVTPPVVETLMIDTSGTKGLSFRSPAVVLDESPPFDQALSDEK